MTTFESRALQLPNDMVVEQLGGFIETTAVYREVFEEDVYFQHGIQIDDGDTVVDVGANIGMFVLRVLRMPIAVRVVAVEPMPPTFAALEKNVQAHGRADAHVSLVHAAVGAQAGSVDFEFYPRATGFSTMFPSDRKRLEPWLLNDLLSHYATFQQRHPLLGALLYPFRKLLLRLIIARRMQPVRMTATLRTLSSMVDEHALTRIDLLKVDVEGAELQVLQGVRDEHWARIKQVVLEVQDLDGRLQVIVDMLRSRGFDLRYEPALEVESAVRLLYARRTR
jgi:FkbM family methyltransferase